jgi:autotransporter-associated beta strand protein
MARRRSASIEGHRMVRGTGKLARTAPWAALLLVLGGCGGGGGGGNVRSDPPPPPATGNGGSNQDQPGFDDHLVLTGANSALAAGYDGSGVTIGLLDTGINRNHPALAGRVLANFVNVDASNDLSVDDKVGHGTTVAQMAAGKPFGQWPGGVAQGATLVSSRIISDAPPSDDGSGEGNEISSGQGYGAYFAALNAELADAGAKIINNSWGGLYWNDPVLTAEFADAYRDFVITRGGLIVFANGNAGADPGLRPNPSDNAALPSKDGVATDLEVGWLAVAALDTLNPTRLTSYSQACGVAMDYCLAAPGDVVFTGADDAAGHPTYWVGSGTSFAAPLVSGAAAVVWSAFPYFDNDLVRQTLLGTAKDLGAPGVDATFGHGLLDVGKAVQGPARFDWGDVAVDFAGTSTWSNQISGAGGLVKRGPGTLVLTQNSTYAGDTRIEGGTLQLGMGMSASDFFIGTGGALKGGGTVQGDVRNDGHIVASGQTGMPLAIGGNYVQGASGWLDAYVGRGLGIGGTATLQGGTLNVLGVYGGYTPSARETMLHAVGGVTGTFDTLAAATSVFLDGALAYDANNVFLDITQLDVTVAAQAMGLSAASQSGAGLVQGAFSALDAGAQATAAPAFLQAAGTLQHTANAAAAERSLSSLSGELHAADAALAMLAADGSRRELEARVDAPRAVGAWASTLDGSRSIGSAIGADMRGWMLGQELRDDTTTWGMAVSRSEGNLWNLGRRDRSHDVQTEGQLYAFREGGDGNYLLGRAAFGRIQRDLQREVLLGDADYGVDSRYADRYLSLGLQAGRHLRTAGGTVTPYIGMQALQLQRGAFREDGAAGFGLDAQASHLALGQALLGVRYLHDWRMGAARMDLHGHMEWQRTLSQHGAIEASFTGIDARAPLMLDMFGRDVGVLGAGFGAQWGAARLTFDLDARHGQSRTDLGAFANWRVSF